MRRSKWSLLRLFCPREEAEYSELLELVLITPLHRGAPMFSATAELSLQSFHETGRARLISSLEQEGCKPPQGPESTGSVKTLLEEHAVDSEELSLHTARQLLVCPRVLAITF